MKHQVNDADVERPGRIGIESTVELGGDQVRDVEQTIMPQQQSSSVAESATSRDGVVTAQLLGQARGRIWLIALVLMALVVLGIPFLVLFQVTGELSLEETVRNVIASAIILVMASVLWWTTRSRWFSDGMVLNLGLAIEVVICYLGTGLNGQATDL